MRCHQIIKDSVLIYFSLLFDIWTNSEPIQLRRLMMTNTTTMTKILSSLLLIISISIQQCNSFSADVSSSQRVFVSTPSKSTQRIVSDLMTSAPNLFTLDPHTPVDEAIVTLLRAGVSGAPVVERLKNAETDQIDNRLIGFVSSFDFLPREESGTLVELGQEEGKCC